MAAAAEINWDDETFICVKFTCACGAGGDIALADVDEGIRCANCGAGWKLGASLSIERSSDVGLRYLTPGIDRPPVADEAPAMSEPIEQAEPLPSAEPAPSTDPVHVPTALKERLQEAGLNLQEAADALNVRKDFLGRVIQGESDLTPNLALRLERLLGAPAAIDWIDWQSEMTLASEAAAMADKLAEITPLEPAL